MIPAKCPLPTTEVCITLPENTDRLLESMGVAFHVTIPAGGHLRPCVSLYRGTNVSVNFGPDFKYKPAGFYGLNTTVEGDERDSLIGRNALSCSHYSELFKKYQSQGESAITSNSLTLNIMRSVGVSALLTDLGVTGMVRGKNAKLIC